MTQYRLVDHVYLRVTDLEADKRFYRAALATLGRGATYDSDDAIAPSTNSGSTQPTRRARAVSTSPSKRLTKTP